MSFDVESLCKDVPLKISTNVISKRIYDDKPINTNIKKNTMPKCIKDTFSFDNMIYEQIDRLSMGSPLAPVLANFIMTELEKIVFQKLATSGMIKFCCRYVVDTLLLAKPADIPHMHNLFNKFDKNLRFTVDKFENEVPHFLDIKISPIGLIIYRKSTHTGQYVNSENFTWNYKISFVRSLVT